MGHDYTLESMHTTPAYTVPHARTLKPEELNQNPLPKEFFYSAKQLDTVYSQYLELVKMLEASEWAGYVKLEQKGRMMNIVFPAYQKLAEELNKSQPTLESKTTFGYTAKKNYQISSSILGSFHLQKGHLVNIALQANPFIAEHMDEKATRKGITTLEGYKNFITKSTRTIKKDLLTRHIPVNGYTITTLLQAKLGYSIGTIQGRLEEGRSPIGRFIVVKNRKDKVTEKIYEHLKVQTPAEKALRYCSVLYSRTHAVGPEYIDIVDDMPLDWYLKMVNPEGDAIAMY